MGHWGYVSAIVLAYLKQKGMQLLLSNGPWEMHDSLHGFIILYNQG